MTFCFFITSRPFTKSLENIKKKQKNVGPVWPVAFLMRSLHQEGMTSVNGGDNWGTPPFHSLPVPLSCAICCEAFLACFFIEPLVYHQEKGSSLYICVQKHCEKNFQL